MPLPKHNFTPSVSVSHLSRFQQQCCTFWQKRFLKLLKVEQDHCLSRWPQQSPEALRNDDQKLGKYGYVVVTWRSLGTSIELLGCFWFLPGPFEASDTNFVLKETNGLAPLDRFISSPIQMCLTLECVSGGRVHRFLCGGNCFNT